MITDQLKKTETHKLTALQPEGWPDIVPHFDFYTNAKYCFPIKISIDNKIVGIGSSIIHDNSAWLAHIIVHPEHRNKGIGKQITQKLIKQTTEKGCKTIQLIATELGAYVYEKVGFKIDTEYIFYKVSENKEKHIASNHVIPYQDSLYENLLAFDYDISGENRQVSLKQHLKNAFIFFKNNKIEGFFLPSFGEGLILASTPEAGIELLKLRLNTHKNVIFPINNSVAKEFTENKGYEIAYRAKRMRLGTKPITKPANIYARIGGNLG